MQEQTFLALSVLLLLVMLIMTIVIVTGMSSYYRNVLSKQEKFNQSSIEMTMKLLAGERERVQSLLNQLMSKDPMTIQALNVATSQTSESNEYVPMTDEAEALRYEQATRYSEYEQEDISDDLSAAGWGAVAGSGGTPVTYGPDAGRAT